MNFMMPPPKPEKKNYPDIIKLIIPLKTDVIILNKIDEYVDQRINCYHNNYTVVEKFIPLEIIPRIEYAYGDTTSLEVNLIAKGKMIVTEESFSKILDNYEKNMIEYKEYRKKNKENIKKQELDQLKKLKKKYEWI